MALKGDRLIVETDISNVCNDVVSQQGLVLCYGNAGSGNAMVDGNQGTVTLAASPSGKVPAGLILATFVNIDQTRQHRNFHKSEQVIGEKAPLLTKGWVVTDQVTGTPTVGATAYLTANGVLTPTVSATGGIAATPKVGIFKSILDEAGFAKVEVNLPVV
jgi:hypothetical protein